MNNFGDMCLSGSHYYFFLFIYSGQLFIVLWLDSYKFFMVNSPKYSIAQPLSTLQFMYKH